VIIKENRLILRLFYIHNYKYIYIKNKPIVAELVTMNDSTDASCNNKKMNLTDAKIELERRGFKIAVDPNNNHNDDVVVTYENGTNNYGYQYGKDTLVAFNTQCVSLCSYRKDLMIFIFQLKTGESLTLNHIKDDLENFVKPKGEEIYLESIGLNNTFPPQGFSRARISIVIYYATTVDADAMEYIWSIPSKKWCQGCLLAVQDVTTGSSSFMENTTPLWGKAFYPEMRYWAGLLTGRMPRPIPDTPPKGLQEGVMVDIVYILLILEIVYLWYTFGFWMIVITLAPLGIFFLVAIIIWLNHRREYLSSTRSNHGQEHLL
jgi:hypothetical protein